MEPVEDIRQAKRNLFQRLISDPLMALPAYLLWGIFKVLPVRLASAVGARLGAVLYLVMQTRNHIGMVNLGIAFPEKSEAEKKAILRKMWAHWGRFYAELPHAKTLYRQATAVGMDHLKKIRQAKTGGFVCSAHLGNWEIAVSQPLFDDFCLNPVYRPANNPWLDRLMFQRRSGVLIPKGSTGAKKILRVLHQGGMVVMLCDQKLREGISVPFFGKPAMTPQAIAVLALKLRVPIVMARSIRQSDGHFRMEITAPLSLPENNDDAGVYQVMADINRRLETWIRENPEQWLWIHRRFDKTEYLNKP